MKFGLREICDVVLRAKSRIKIGTLEFTKDMPVLYFDSLKTSSLEGAATTVYAQGGKGNTRLIAWEGEKTVTFTMEDALISKESLAVLTGANVISAGESGAIPVHTTETVVVDVPDSGANSGKVVFELEKKPYEDLGEAVKDIYTYLIPLDDHGDINGQPQRFTLKAEATGNPRYTCVSEENAETLGVINGKMYLIDYYEAKQSGLTEIQITAGDFAGYYYLEASTLFRNKNGEDLPAEFIIPNCKIQSNFTFTMAPTGDPSTFTFTLDAFPDYTKYNKTKKVLAAIQVIEDSNTSIDNVTVDGHYTATGAGGETNTNTSTEPGTPATTYTITAGEGITITDPADITNGVAAGTTVTYSVTVEENKQLTGVTMNGTSLGTTNPGTFTMPAADVTLTATIDPIGQGRRRSILNNN